MITLELLQEATNAESILQYIEGALIEIFIIATLLKIDVDIWMRWSMLTDEELEKLEKEGLDFIFALTHTGSMLEPYRR